MAAVIRHAYDKNTDEVIRPGEGFFQIELLKLTPTCAKLAGGYGTSEAPEAGLTMQFNNATMDLTESFQLVSSENPDRNLTFSVDYFELKGFTHP